MKQPVKRDTEPVRAGLTVAIGAIIVVLGLFALALYPNALAGIPESAKAKPLASPTLLIENKTGHGSGVYLGKGFVLTASHVIETVKDQSDIIVQSDDGVRRHVEILWFNQYYDIGLLRLTDESPNIRPADLACRAPILGEPITVEGSPLMFDLVRTHGHVGSRVTSKLAAFWARVFELNASVAPGNSGGPVYDQSGRVIGIVVGLIPLPMQGLTTIATAVPSSVACMLMARV